MIYAPRPGDLVRTHRDPTVLRVKRDNVIDGDVGVVVYVDENNRYVRVMWQKHLPPVTYNFDELDEA